MTYFTGIDVSLRSVTICIVDQEGKVCHEAKTPARPDAIAQALKEFSADARRVGLESGTLTQYLTYGLQASGCMESRQVKNTLASMRNKTDLPLPDAAIDIAGGYRQRIDRGVDDGPDEVVYVCCASKRAQKRGSPLRRTNACSAGSDDPPTA